MNIQAEKLGLIEWIARLNDISVIEKLKKIYDENSLTSDWKNEISLSEKESIERGLKDFEEVNIHSDETARKVYAKYL